MASRRTRSVTPPPEYPEHLGFILAEDAALKHMLETSLTLPDAQRVEKPVRVWYRYPESEHQIIYPFATIDLVGIEPALDVWHSEYRMYADDETEEAPDGSVSGHRLRDPSTSKTTDYGDPSLYFWRRNFLAYYLYYQIGLWTNQAVHDRLLSARMIRDIIMPHPSWLYVEADGSWKRMESLGWNNADMPSQEGASKRIFRKFYTVSVQTDIPQDRLANLALVPHIQKLLLRMEDRGNPGTYFTPDETTQYWETLHDWTT